MPAGTFSTTEDEDLAITGISISDIDAGDDDVEVTLSVDDGTLTLKTDVTGGVVADDVSGNGTGSVTVTGALDEINATLNDGSGLTYRSDAAFSGTETLTVTTDDQGHSGSGGAKTDTDTLGIIVDAAPSVSSITPADGATDVAANAPITVNFSESVNATTNSFELKCPASGSAKAFTLSSSPDDSFTLTPTSNLPGATTCQMRVIASQITDADNNDPPDSMAADYTSSFTTASRAVDDDYSQDFTVAGNVSFDSANASPGFGVTDNDELTGSTQITSSGWQGNNGDTEKGGDVTVNSDGTFTYDPPAGYEGNDRFTYTISGGSTATVTLKVGGMVWFIDGNASSNGDGRLSSPFNTLSAFNSVNDGTGNRPAAGDNIFLYESGSNYSGPVTLLDNQKLIGQDASQSLTQITGVTPPSGSPSFPATDGGTADANKATITTTASSTDAVKLKNGNTGNTLRGFTVGDKTGSGISGSNFGTLNVADTSISGGGQALNLSTGTLAGNGFTGVSSSSGTNNVYLSNVGTSGTPALGTSSDALSGASSDAFKIDGGSGSFTYAGKISNTSTLAVNVANKTGGAVTFSGDINPTSANKGISVSGNSGGTTVNFSGANKKINTGTGTGVNLSNNGSSGGATVNFTNGGLAVTGTSNAAGFSATGGGTVTVQEGTNANSIGTATGTALNVANTTIGSSGLKFRSISANGATNGIVLNNTGNTAGLTVSGNGGTCSSAATCTGGAIQNTTADGVSLTNTRSPSFDRVLIKDTGGHGIAGTTTSDLNLSNSLVQGAGDADNEAGLYFATTNGTNLTGNSSITNTVVDAPADVGAFIQNYGGTLNLTVSGSTFKNTQKNTPGVVTGDDLLRMVADRTGSGSATITAKITGSTFDRSESDGIAAFAQSSVSATDTGGGTMNLTANGNTFSGENGGSTCPNGCNDNAVITQGAQGSTIRFTIQNNDIQNQRNEAIAARADNTSNVQGIIQSNTIGTETALSGSYSAQGIFLDSDDNADLVARVQNNTIRSTFWQGIWANATDGGGGTPKMDVAIVGNTTPTPVDTGGTYLPSIDVQGTTNANACAKVEGNTAQAGRGGAGSVDLLQFDTATFKIEGLPSPTNDASSYVAGKNPASASPVYALAGAGKTFTGGTCRTPASTPTP